MLLKQQRNVILLQKDRDNYGNKKEALVLVVKNPLAGSLKRNKDGKLLSTKEDSKRHGYGINSVIKVARKYNGDVIIEEEGGEFVITVTMNLENF